jgi:hypothetical protein
MFRMFQGIKVQINVQIDPMKVTAAEEMHAVDFRNARTLEPRKILIRQEILLAPYIEPNPVLGNIENFNR